MGEALFFDIGANAKYVTNFRAFDIRGLKIHVDSISSKQSLFALFIIISSKQLHHQFMEVWPPDDWP